MLRAFIAFYCLIACPLFSQSQTSFTYMTDVYALSIYGDVAAVNPMWWASDQSAAWVAARLHADPVLRYTTPQTGPALQRWHVAHVPLSLLPPAGMRQSDPQKILLLMDLPEARMWALRFGNGCEVNAGYLESYFQRNVIASDGGLGQVRRIVAGECGEPMSFAVRALTAPVRAVRRVVRGPKYPSVWASGHEPKQSRRK